MRSALDNAQMRKEVKAQLRTWKGCGTPVLNWALEYGSLVHVDKAEVEALLAPALIAPAGY